MVPSWGGPTWLQTRELLRWSSGEDSGPASTAHPGLARWHRGSQHGVGVALVLGCLCWLSFSGVTPFWGDPFLGMSLLGVIPFWGDPFLGLSLFGAIPFWGDSFLGWSQWLQTRWSFGEDSGPASTAPSGILLQPLSPRHCRAMPGPPRALPSRFPRSGGMGLGI